MMIQDWNKCSGAARCAYLRRASHPHHGHDGRAETQGLLQAALQQAEIFQLRTKPGQYELVCFDHIEEQLRGTFTSTSSKKYKEHICNPS